MNRCALDLCGIEEPTCWVFLVVIIHYKAMRIWIKLIFSYTQYIQ